MEKLRAIQSVRTYYLPTGHKRHINKSNSNEGGSNLWPHTIFLYRTKSKSIVLKFKVRGAFKVTTTTIPRGQW